MAHKPLSSGVSLTVAETIIVGFALASGFAVLALTTVAAGRRLSVETTQHLGILFASTGGIVGVCAALSAPIHPIAKAVAAALCGSVAAAACWLLVGAVGSL